MDTLLEMLNTIESSELPAMGFDDIYLHYNDHPMVGQIEDMACDMFIDSQGKPKFDLIDLLQIKHGYVIYPGERDRFGWLTACLQTKKGIIVFG